VVIVANLALGWLGHISKTTWRIFGKRVYFDLKAMPHLLEDGEKPGRK
jgi:hypothetical protein